MFTKVILCDFSGMVSRNQKRNVEKSVSWLKEFCHGRNPYTDIDIVRTLKCFRNNNNYRNKVDGQRMQLIG